MAVNSQPAPVLLPQTTIQHDFQAAISDVRDGTSSSEDIWISCYLKGATSVHGKATVSPHEGGDSAFVLEARDGLEITATSSLTYEVSCPPLGISKTTLRSPRAVYGEVKAQQIPRAIHAFDVSPNGALYATGYDNGSIAISSTSTSSTTPPKTSKPHASTITSLRFFPSNEVLLASSLDMSLSVISAVDMSVPRKLKGHSRSVTDTAILERGKNVVSCAKDGTVRLWDVGAGKQIRMMGVESYSAVLKMTHGTNHVTIVPSDDADAVMSEVEPRPQMSVMEGEVGTQYKVLCCALQSGRFTILDLTTKSTIFTATASAPSSPLHAIAYKADRHLLATGSAHGVISIYDTRALGVGKAPLVQCQRNGACVEDLAFVEGDSESGSRVSLAVATVDGLPFRLGLGIGGDAEPLSPYVMEELVGLDCDPVRVVRVRGNDMWIAGDDGVVRKY